MDRGLPARLPTPLPDRMAARDVIDLLLLSVLWGAAYLFMRAAVPAFGPAPMIALRFGLAALLLLPIMLWRGGWPVLRAHPRQMLIVGVPYTAVPFMLLAYGSLHLTAGLVATVPSELRGAALGLYSLAGFAGGMVGPTIFGFALDLGGDKQSVLSWALGYAAIGAGCLAAPLVVRLFARPR